MNDPSTANHRVLLPGRALVVALAAALIGCGGGQATIDVGRTASERPDLEPSVVARGMLALPGADGFNLSDFSSTQNGDARGESRSVDTSGATCRAEARSGGAATGQFVLGYMFDNTTNEALDAVVKLRLSFTSSMASTGTKPGAAGRLSSTSTTVSFEIKGSNGAVLRSEPIVSSAGAEGPRSTQGTRELVVDVRFEPGLGYYLYVAGRCSAQAADDGEVNAAVEISDYSLELTWRRAAGMIAVPAPAASDS